MTGGRVTTTGSNQAATDSLAHLRTGNAEAAYQMADEALKQATADAPLLQARGLAALQLGKAEQAAADLKAALKLAPEQSGLWEIYGGALEALDRLEDAVAAYREAEHLNPQRPSAKTLLGIALLRLDRSIEAKHALEDAVALDKANPEAWFWLGSALFATMALDKAEEAFGQAITLRPDWAKAWLNRAITRVESRKYEEAFSDYQKAIDLAPNDIATLRQFAITLWELQHVDEAERMFQKVLEKEPNDTATLANLASMYEHVNRLDEAAKIASEALALDPDNTTAQKVAATLERRKGDPAKALAQLEAISSRPLGRADRESVEFEFARLHDKLGNTDEAYSHFAEANRQQTLGPAGQRVDGSKYLANIQREADILAGTPPEDFPLPPEDTPPDPVFLMGFPRSGTTLLDQVLDSHPDVAVMEERPPLAEVHDRLTNLERTAGKAFTRLDDEQRKVARQFYFQRVSAFVPDAGIKLFVDKHPLATVKIRIIKLLFPRARILFSLRHPCDVVLSCFMQRFTVNEAMTHFQTLAGAVDVYDRVMSLWHRFGPAANLPVHFVRYEQLVQDFDTEVRSALKFLDLPWDERVGTFHEHALGRRVRTASYEQVTQPLYTSALARWRRYEKYLEPHLDVIRPHANAFGYTLDS